MSLSPSDWLLQMVLEFYKQYPDSLDLVYKIANHLFVVGDAGIPSTKERKLSVRVVNWFVSNYAKQHLPMYSLLKHDTDTNAPILMHDSIAVHASLIPDGYSADRFIVWNRYCAAKGGYDSKDMFDPYCRRSRIAVQLEDGTVFSTTLGQLNFFRWAIQNKVIDYIVAHYDEIVRDMGARLTSKAIRITEEDGDGCRRTRKKREELSTSACRGIKKISIVLDEPVVNELNAPALSLPNITSSITPILS